MTAGSMRTDNMSVFLKQVSKARRNKFVVMVLDGASTHKSKALVIPANVSLIILPPYSPELNPAERLRNKLRRGCFSDRYFDIL
jgi:transposase